MRGHLTSAQKGLQGFGKRTRRARLKGWRPGAPNRLSAHLFSGASCETLWHPQTQKVLTGCTVPGVPGRELFNER